MNFYLFYQPTLIPSVAQDVFDVQNQPLNFVYRDQPLFDLFTQSNNFPLIYSIPCQTPAQHPQLHPATTPQMSSKGNKARLQKEKRRRMCLQKQIKSAKKNGESNLINQLFSFLSQPQRSSKLVRKALSKVIKPGASIQKIQQLFYNIVRLINIKRGRKYVNKNILLQYFRKAQSDYQITEISPLFAKTTLLQIQEFSRCLRIVCYSFVRSQSVNVVLTSKRISSVAQLCHLKKKRILQKFMTNACNRE